MKELYEINGSTLAVIALPGNRSRIYEEEREFDLNVSTTSIIDHSCRFFGSSYVGRFEGTKNLLGINYKAPIIVEESRELIFFPTSSPRFEDCSWISISHLKEYQRSGKYSKVLFYNGLELPLYLSYGSLQNQALRATRLQVVLRSRKLNKCL